jgi:23S rRNA G2445 N2-methylase RlmL
MVGRHCHVTLYNADCLELPWMDADALISDPPYGIAYCHGARKGGVKMGTDGQAIIGDDKPDDRAAVARIVNPACGSGNFLPEIYVTPVHVLELAEARLTPPNDPSSATARKTNE